MAGAKLQASALLKAMPYNISGSNVVAINSRINRNIFSKSKYKFGGADLSPNVVPLRARIRPVGRPCWRMAFVAVPQRRRIAGVATFVVSAAAMVAAIQVLAMPQVHAWRAELIAVFMRGLSWL